MTPAELREAAEVMRRAADGEQVQCQDREGWWNLTWPEWNWSQTKYRIAPKPREVWINGNGSRAYAYTERAEAEQAACRGMKPRLFREVLNEQGGAV